MRSSVRPLFLLLAVLLLLIGEVAPRVCRFLEPQYRDVDLALLGGFHLNPRDGTIEDIPAQIRAMDGTNVRIRGNAIHPMEPAVKGIWVGRFLWRDPEPGAVQRFVLARARGGGRLLFPDGEAATVEGRLHVQLDRGTGGFITGVYSIDVDRIEPPGVRPSWWPFTLAGALVAAYWGLLFIRDSLQTRNRLRIGLCHRCGYDCRATPDRCPECGAVPSARAANPGGAKGAG